MALESCGAIDLRHSTYTVNLRRAVGGVLDPELLHPTFKIVRSLLIGPAQPCSRPSNLRLLSSSQRMSVLFWELINI